MTHATLPRLTKPQALRLAKLAAAPPRCGVLFPWRDDGDMRALRGHGLASYMSSPAWGYSRWRATPLGRSVAARIAAGGGR